MNIEHLSTILVFGLCACAEDRVIFSGKSNKEVAIRFYAVSSFLITSHNLLTV